MGATQTPHRAEVHDDPSTTFGPVPSSRAVAVGVLAVGLAAAAWNFAVPELGFEVSPTTAEIVQGIGNGALQVAGATALAAGAARQRGRRRVAWGVIALGAVVAAVGTVTWTTLLIRTSDYPATAVGDAMFAVALLLTIVGVLLLPPSETRSRRVRMVDAAILMVATLTLVWVAPVHPQAGGRVLAGLPTVNLAEIVTVVTILVAVGALARNTPDRFGEVGLATGTLTCAGVGMLLYAGSPIGYDGTSRLANVLFAVGFAMAIAAGLRLCGPSKPPRRRGGDQTRHWLGLPEIATVTTLVAVTLHERVDNTPIGSLTLATIAVALAIFRLQQLGTEQRRLGRSLHRSADQLYTDARTDTLTGLGNRLALDEHLRTTLSREARRPVGERRALAVLYVDVDHFKRYNDALGHAVGDGLLAEVARRLSEVAGPHSYRLGGDEFIAVSEVTVATSGSLLARQLVRRFDEPVDVGPHEMRAAVSVGVATWAGEELSQVPDPAELLRRADLALYRSKEQGGGRWTAFDPALAERAAVQHRLRTGLQGAAARGEFEVHLEPVVDLHLRTVVGVSARLHWRSVEFGMLGPDVVVPAAAEGGLLPTTTGALLTEVERTLLATRGTWAARPGEPLWVGVRLTRDELVHPAASELLMSCLERPDVDPARLHVDITEDAVADDAALDVVAGLRQMGASVTVEGFGTGPSSLLRLTHYPASTIRVDASFVQGLGRRSGDTAIVEAVAELAEELGLGLSADGIDEEFQARRLADLGFRNGRGRLFGERVHLEDLCPPTAHLPEVR